MNFRPKYFLQRVLGHRLLGTSNVHYLRMYKMILSYKLGYGYEYTDFLARFLNRGDVILDIGANIGKQACRFSRIVGPEGKVLCFEPVEISFKFLSKMKNILRLENTEVFKVAIGNRSSVQSIYIPVLKDKDIEIGTRASLKADATDYENVEYRTEEVCVKTIDHLMAELNLDRLNFIKSDTEEFELEVLEGGRETIEKHRPVIQLEMDYRDPGLREIYALGYSPHYVVTNQLVSASEVAEPSGNVLLLP